MSFSSSAAVNEAIDTEYSQAYGKFENDYFTADGSDRAEVSLSRPATLWFNTGTLCNIACQNCYIESTPTNDRLEFISADEVSDYLFQLREREWGVKQIGFTGGEPFMNPEIIEILERCLAEGYEVLVLTNAMRPMMRPRVQQGLINIQKKWGEKFCIRVSLDHYTQTRHDSERGRGTFAISLLGMDWLKNHGIKMAVAGRTIWGEDEKKCREGFAQLFKAKNYNIDAYDPTSTVLFPEIDPNVSVPEITTACWKILDVNPNDMMCASSRMVIKRKGANSPTVVACTLLPYDPKFDLGSRLEDAENSVRLNHPYCAQFCVLGGASCSRA